MRGETEHYPARFIFGLAKTETAAAGSNLMKEPVIGTNGTET